MTFWKQWLPGGLPTTEEDAGTERVPLPRVGETVRLSVANGTRVGVYHARVRAVGLRRLFLDSPESVLPGEDNDLSPTPALPPRMLINLSYLRADNLYECETRVVGPSKAGSLMVSRPRVVTRIQRRQFYRLPLQASTTFRVQGEALRTAPIPARLVNLSGGGALLAAAKPVLGGLRVSVRVPAGKHGDLREVTADALDCRVTMQGLTRTYLVRLRFLGPPMLTEEERDEIVAYIFEQQRLLLRTRKLLR